MTEPLRKYSSPDVPEFASYPAQPDEFMEATVVVESEFDALPVARADGYDAQGRKIGTALGHLVNQINEIIAPVRSQIEEKIEDATESAEIAYSEASNRFRELAEHKLYAARAKATELRRQARQTVDEYPMHTVAAAAVVGIIAGIGLRLWRENRG